MKVLLAPTNYAGQVSVLFEELKRRAVDVTMLQYGFGEPPYGYATDQYIRLDKRDRLQAQIDTLTQCLDEGYDIWHFWSRTLLYGSPMQNEDVGFDLPFIKARGGRVVYRFTGMDLRDRQRCLATNPYSPFHEDYFAPTSERAQRQYGAMLRCYVDRFVVQDAEMRQHCPDAAMIPRAINLELWPFVGVGTAAIPLVVHAPTDGALKGTHHIVPVLEKLQDEGLLRYKLVQGMSHQEARQWLEAADIVVDQVMLGYYGVVAVEAMALGKPVVAYVLEDLYRAYESPVVNANPDTLGACLRELVGDGARRQRCSQEGREFVERIHDVRKVAEHWLRVYEQVLRKPAMAPATTHDVDCILGQWHDVKAERSALQQKRDAVPDWVVRLANLAGKVCR